jgi:hypothetical protein
MAVELIEGPARLQATRPRCQSTIAFGADEAWYLPPINGNSSYGVKCPTCGTRAWTLGPGRQSR